MSTLSSWILGTKPDCDIVVKHPTVSGHHCRLTRSANGWAITDLQSSNGTFVNGVRIAEPTMVSERDRITLGATVNMPWPQSARGGSKENDAPTQKSGVAAAFPSTCSAVPSQHSDEHPPATVAIHGSSILLGRAPQCDCVLDYPMVSWRHARISRDQSVIVVEDLNSTNGTFVNGERISKRTKVSTGDVVGLGSYRFSLQDDGKFRQRDYRGDLTVEARGVVVHVGRRRLLQEVSLTIYPSEFVGLMGPSGAGKSTLMNVLNGYTPPHAGQVLVNGRSLYQHFDEFRGMIGFVPQDDIMHPELTVREALFYSARIRLPKDVGDRDIHKRIDEVLAQLGLTGTDNVLIGSPSRKGISGGQRKRVNLAMELLTDPSVLFLDEPTSGLSSEDTLAVLQVLRQLADSGKTILLTIHQPSLDAFRLLDNVVVVAKDAGSDDAGRMVYFGPAYPDSIQFFTRRNDGAGAPAVPLVPDMLLKGLANQPATAWCKRYQNSECHRVFVKERAGSPAGEESSKGPQRRPTGSGPTQFVTLVRRSLAVKRRDVANTAILLAQAPIIATLLVMVFGGKTSTEITDANWSSSAHATSITLFMLSLSSIWFGCSNSVREIVGESPIYMRERMVTLQLPWYVAAKFTVLGGLCFVQCLVLLSVVHWGNALHGPWLPMLGLLFLSSTVGVALGLAISAIVKTSEVAIATLPLVLLPMVILGGILQPQHEMSAPMRWCSNAMPSRWSFEGLLLSEAAVRPKSPGNGMPLAQPNSTSDHTVGSPPPNPTPTNQGVDIGELYFPRSTDRMGIRACVFALGMMLCMLVVTIQTSLRSRDVH